MTARRSRTPLAHVLEHVRARPSRTWSIIISLYGDAIVPRGGSVGLATVLQFCAHLGIGDGVVRTAMSRLAADGWLERRRVARHSFYAIAERGRATFLDASSHIYSQQPAAWHGAFALLVADTQRTRPALRTVMATRGFGVVAPGMWIAPPGQAAPPALGTHLRLTLTGDDGPQRALAARAWPIAEMAEAYSQFLAVFTPLHAAVTSGRSLDALDALAARVLLVHEYRRIVLRDPILPLALLPAEWPGTDARRLCADIYARVVPPSEQWLDAHAVNEQGLPLPHARGLRPRFRA